MTHHGNRPHSLTGKPAKIEGFSFIELIVVIAIIGILAAIAIPAYSSYINKTREKRAIAELNMLEKSISTYFLENNNRYPDSLADISQGGLNDPWGHPYEYLKIEGSAIKGKGKLRKDRFLNPLNSDYDLYSVGPDGRSQLQLQTPVSQDDIIRANNGGYIGVASDF